MLILRTENYIAFQKSIFLHVHMKLHQNLTVENNDISLFECHGLPLPSANGRNLKLHGLTTIGQ